MMGSPGMRHHNSLPQLVVFFCFRGPDLVLVNSILPNGFRWGGHGSLLVICKLQIFRGAVCSARRTNNIKQHQTLKNALCVWHRCDVSFCSRMIRQCRNVFCMCCTSGEDRLQRRCLIQMATGSLRLTP